MSSPISIIVEDIPDMIQYQTAEDGTVDPLYTGVSPNKPKTKFVYVVKNARNIPVESVISAVLEASGSQSPLEERSTAPPNSSVKRKKVRSRKRKRSPDQDKTSQKVFVKGSDGKENMIFLDVPLPLDVEICSESEEVDDPVWVPSNPDRVITRPAAWSKLKRARTAVKNSVRTLRLPKPHKKRETRRERALGKSSSGKHMVRKDDPNYELMMEKFAKPVSISTMKRHGLYKPKPNTYKIDAPYKKDVAPYIEKISDTEFKCKICLTAKFRWNYKAEIHILEHLDWRPFECDLCGRAFTQNQYLSKHKRLHFPEDTNFMCEVCGKGFQRRYYLTYHMDEHYDRTYSCQECGRKFTRRQKHDEHVRYHHKCHYSVCDICGQTLRTTALARHRKQHGEKGLGKRKKGNDEIIKTAWLACHVCGRSSRNLRERDEHEAEHNNPLLPFHCEECTVYFKSKRSHMRHIARNHNQIAEEDLEAANHEEECEVATHVLDEMSSTIVVSIPEEI